MKKTPNVWMWRFQYNHMMEITSNPVESCMKWLKEDLFGLGNPRDASLFNRYRLMIMWIMECSDKRRDELEGEFCVVYTKTGVPKLTPWAVMKLLENGHLVELYGDYYAVECMNALYCNMRSVEWDGVLRGNGSGLGTCFRVIDTKLKVVFMVNILFKKNPCSCHVTHWQKIPCVHLMMVLKMLGKMDMIWDFFGEEYKYDKVEKTCANWNEEERRLFDWLWKLELDEEEGDKFMLRETARSNGRTERRKRCIGNEPGEDEEGRVIELCS